MIETNRLTLRPISAGDEELYYRLYSDEEILRYSPFDTMDRAAVKRHLQRLLWEWEQPVPANYEYAVVRRQDGIVIGRCHIEPDPETDTAMIGCHLLKAFWRQGYATEICRALMDHAFEHLQVHRVNALCNPENLGSRGMLEACGLRLGVPDPAGGSLRLCGGTPELTGGTWTGTWVTGVPLTLSAEAVISYTMMRKSPL